MTYTGELVLFWMSIAFLVTGLLLTYRRYRKYRDTLAWSKVMVPE